MADNQAAVACITFEQFSKLLNLPEGHKVERIAVGDIRYRPGLEVVISGPKLPYYSAQDPLWIQDWDGVREMLDRDG